MRTSSRRRLAAVTTLLCCLALVISPVAAGIGGAADSGGGPEAASALGTAGATPAAQSAPDNPCAGTVSAPADGTTVISVQGMRFGKQGGKRPAKLVGVGPRGEIRWVHQSAAEYDVVWGYDVDPMANGNVFVTATVPGHETILYEFDPDTQERVWTERFDIADTHDADLINNGTAIVVANMRHYNETSGENEDRVFVYNRTTERIEWEWHFDDHYDRGAISENYTHDWTHLNDVDKVGDDQFILSPRNFDQVIVVNRTTDEIDMKLGADEEFATLKQQHNPDYLESADGTPTVLVADSENGRIAEYAREGEGKWTRTWTLKGDLAWPRDADRLANGNTLVGDSANHRVVEVTPEGEVVWEFYSPWLVYDVARLSQTNESGGPTVSDLGATGTYEVSNSAGLHRNASQLEACNRRLENVTGWAAGQSPTETADGATTEGAMNDGTESGDGAGDGENTDAETTDDASGDVPGFGPVAALVAVVGALGAALLRGRGP